eukprot:4563218-Pyramimonas_sp.AAC.1
MDPGHGGQVVFASLVHDGQRRNFALGLASWTVKQWVEHQKEGTDGANEKGHMARFRREH